MDTIALLRDISVVIIAIQVFIILLVPGAIYFLLIKGVGWLQLQVNTYGPEARRVFREVARVTEDASHKVAAPVMAVSTNAARVRRVRQVAPSLWGGKEVQS